MPQGTWLIIDRFLKTFIYLFIFGRAGPSLLHRLFSSRGERRLLSRFGVWASHYGGFSCCRAWALDPVAFSTCSWAQWFWLPGSRAHAQ